MIPHLVAMKTTMILLFAGLGPAAVAAELRPIHLPAGAAERLQLEVAPVTARPVTDPVRATGRLIIDPAATAVVASRISGQVEEDALRIGDAVKKGQVLLTLRSGQLAASVTTYLQAELDLRFARTTLEREQGLAARKLTTNEALQQREAAYQQARTAHLAAIQPMYLLGYREGDLHDMVDRGPIREDLTLYQVKSPIDGVVIEKATVPGTPVESNQTLLTVADIDHLLIELQVPLRGVERVREGLEIEFKTTAGGGRRGQGKLLGMAAAARAETVAATALARLDNPERDWIAGTPVEVLLADPDAPAHPAVPTGAVVEIDGRPCVFCEEGPDVLRPVEVEVLARGSDWCGLGPPIKAGRRVVVRGAALLLAAWEHDEAPEAE